MTRTISVIVALTAALCLALSFPAAAQPNGPQPQPGKGWGGPKGPRYDPAKVETVTGMILEVKRTAPRKPGQPARVAFRLKTDKETLMVHLGPADYLDQQNLAIAPGDKVEVKGVRQVRPRQIVFMAGEIRKGGKVVKLRDDQGRPLGRQGPGPGSGPRPGM